MEKKGHQSFTPAESLIDAEQKILKHFVDISLRLRSILTVLELRKWQRRGLSKHFVINVCLEHVAVNKITCLIGVHH